MGYDSRVVSVWAGTILSYLFSFN